MPGYIKLISRPFALMILLLTTAACKQVPVSSSLAAENLLLDQRFVKTGCEDSKHMSHQSVFAAAGVFITNITPDACGQRSQSSAFGLQQGDQPRRVVVILSNPASMANDIGGTPTTEEIENGRKGAGVNPNILDTFVGGAAFDQENEMAGKLKTLAENSRRAGADVIEIPINLKPDGVSVEEYIQREIAQRYPEGHNGPVQIVYGGHGNVRGERHTTGGTAIRVTFPDGTQRSAPTQAEAKDLIKEAKDIYKRTGGQEPRAEYIENDYYTTDLINSAAGAIHPNDEGETTAMVFSCFSGQVIEECKNNPELRNAVDEVVTSSPADASTSGMGMLDHWDMVSNGLPGAERFDLDGDGNVSSEEFANASGEMNPAPQHSRATDVVMGAVVTTRPTDFLPGAGFLPSVRAQKARDRKFLRSQLSPHETDNTPQVLNGNTVITEVTPRNPPINYGGNSNQISRETGLPENPNYRDGNGDGLDDNDVISGG